MKLFNRIIEGTITTLLLLVPLYTTVGCTENVNLSTTPGTTTTDMVPTPQLEHITRERREILFDNQQITLAGELDIPRNDGLAPLVVIIHHSGPVERNAYGYLAEILLTNGYAVFRFDKRGTGASGGVYGCCESADALAAYQAAIQQAGIDRCNVFIVAQSIGTTYLAAHYDAYMRIHQPQGVALLSNLLRADQVTQIVAPLHIIVADSEPNLDAIGVEAVVAYNNAHPYGATYYVAEGAEHTLFDIRAGPIDWRNPKWVTRYHQGAMNSLLDWLNQHRVAPNSCTPVNSMDVDIVDNIQNSGYLAS